MNRLNAAMTRTNASHARTADQSRRLNQSVRENTLRIASLVGVGTIVAQKFTQAEDIQTKAIAINTTLAKLYEENDESINQLRGSNFDLLEEIISLKEEGVQNLSQDILDLNARMLLTGQDTSILHKLLGRTSTQLMLNTEEQNSLIDTIKKTSAETGTRSDKMIAALQKVADSLGTAKALGGGEGLTALFLSLEGRLKETDADALNRLVSKFIEADFEDLATFTRLGIRNEVDRLVTSRNLSQAQEALTSILEKGGAAVEGFVGTPGGGVGFTFVNERLNVLGNSARDTFLNIKQLNSAFSRSTETFIEGTEEINTLKVAVGTATKGLEDAFASIYDATIGKLFPTVVGATQAIAVLVTAIAGMSLVATGLRALGSAAALVLSPLGGLVAIAATVGIAFTELTGVTNLFGRRAAEADEEKIRIANATLAETRAARRTPAAPVTSTALMNIAQQGIRASLASRVMSPENTKTESLLRDIKETLRAINAKSNAARIPTRTEAPVGPLGGGR
jgi:uncharacterized protein (DUF697 family)